MHVFDLVCANVVWSLVGCGVVGSVVWYWYVLATLGHYSLQLLLVYCI